MQTETSVDDEISLMDIYDFLADGWKIILSIAFIGTGIGVVTSLALPDQFEAAGLIQSASVGGMSSTNSIPVEPISVLVEKMQSPTYYDSKTLAVCVGEGEAGNLGTLAKALNAKVLRTSNFVSVVYRAESKDKALRCLEQVLVAVVENQKGLVEENLTSAMSSLDNEKKAADEGRKAVKELEQLVVDRRAQLKFKDVEYSMVTELIVAMHEAKRQLMAIERTIY